MPAPLVMITFRPCGLGNQLFQYAAGFTFARRSCVPLRLDLDLLKSELNHSSPWPRPFELFSFNITAGLTSPKERFYFRYKPMASKVARFYDKMRTFGQPSMVMESRERQRVPINEILYGRARRPIMIQGYFECAAYTESFESELRREFTFKDPPSSRVESFAGKLREHPSVAVHVRAGDLLHDPKAINRRIIPGAEYFERAAALILAAEPNARFFVFSDEMNYARQVVRLPNASVTFVEPDPPFNAVEDLRLMCQCTHHILTPSTFGWWGAWLAKSPRQIVIAPDSYFTSNNPPLTHYYPVAWRLI